MRIHAMKKFIAVLVLAGLAGTRTTAMENVCPVSANVRGHENIEWSKAYAYGLTDESRDLPRVLLVGDSICNGYQERVRELLKGKMNVSYWISSYCVTSPHYQTFLGIYLDEAKYDVVHFNNGLHSLGTAVADWGKGLEAALRLIREKQPGAKIVWATSTPLADAAKTAKAKELNAAAVGIVARLGGIGTDDLFALLDPLDREENWEDLFHHNESTRAMEAEQVAASVLSACPAAQGADGAVATTECDLVIYGSSPAAIAAAVQAKRMGKTAVVVSPETRIGGLTTGGLGQTDIGNKSAFGGIALEFYRDVAKWYAEREHWTRQSPEEYNSCVPSVDDKETDSMWTFEPSAALAILEGWEKRDGLDIRRGEWLDRESGVEKKDGRVVSIKTLSGNVYRGKVFIDATYEGDLVAAAGVSYHIGREANCKYGEMVNGIQPEAKGSRHHNFSPGVSPYVVEGDRKSGLLPGIEPRNASERPGDGDGRVQAYCFRMCLTDALENRIPFKKPEGYDERDYELLFREYAAVDKNPSVKRPPGCLSGKNRRPCSMSPMPNRKTDSNNLTAFSTDFIGANGEWPEASYERRKEIFDAHLKYQQGLMWTLANHPRIPADVREQFSNWGTCRDEFLDGCGDGWQSQLYVREARRMVGETVMTEHHCRGREKSSRPVAMAAYAMDSHHVRRVETADGFVRNEGNVEDDTSADGTSRMKPYGIDYGSIVPRRGECSNLLVPVCLSASHIAFGSIRMEPVFFALGQAAGTAAAMAAEKSIAVQDVPYGELAKRLLEDGQVICSKFASFNVMNSAPIPQSHKPAIP